MKIGARGGESLSLEIRVGGGSSGLGNPVRRGGKKCLPLIRGVCIFSGITHCHVRELDNADNEGVAHGLPYLEVLKGL